MKNVIAFFLENLDAKGPPEVCGVHKILNFRQELNTEILLTWNSGFCSWGSSFFSLKLNLTMLALSNSRALPPLTPAPSTPHRAPQCTDGPLLPEGTLLGNDRTSLPCLILGALSPHPAYLSPGAILTRVKHRKPWEPECWLAARETFG